MFTFSFTETKIADEQKWKLSKSYRYNLINRTLQLFERFQYSFKIRSISANRWSRKEENENPLSRKRVSFVPRQTIGLARPGSRDKKKKKLKKTSSREQRSRKGAGEGVKLWAREGRKKERREEKAIKRRSRFELAFSVNSGVPIPLQPRNSSVGPFYLPLSLLLSLSRDLDNSRIVLSRANKFTGSTLASLRARFSTSGDDAIAAIVILIIRGGSLSMIYGAHVVVHVFRKYRVYLPPLFFLSFFLSFGYHLFRCPISYLFLFVENSLLDYGFEFLRFPFFFFHSVTVLSFLSLLIYLEYFCKIYFYSFGWIYLFIYLFILFNCSFSFYDNCCRLFFFGREEGGLVWRGSLG